MGADRSLYVDLSGRVIGAEGPRVIVGAALSMIAWAVSTMTTARSLRKVKPFNGTCTIMHVATCIIMLAIPPLWHTIERWFNS